MNVKELKEKLSQFPDDMEVMLDERHTEFRYGLLNGVRQGTVRFGEGEDDIDYEVETPPYADVECVILDEL